MVTIRTISEKCGLSVAAVSKALNGRPGVSPEKAEMVRQTAQELGYFPNAAARTLKTNRSMNIGILFKNVLAHEYFSVILEAVRDTAEKRGYDITFLNNPSREQGYYEHAKRRQCDGILIVQPGYGEDARAAVRRLAESELPVVAIDDVFPGRTTVTGENVASVEEIVRYLYGMGHTRIAFIHGENGDVTSQRLAGFYRACRDLGIAVPSEYVVPARYQEPADSALATRKLLQCRVRPTCIMYPDDIAYLGGQAELEAQGLSIPGDVSCFGFDGIRMAGVLRPSLATYRQNGWGIGATATEQLISAIEDPKCYVPGVITISGSVQPGGTVKRLTGAEQK